eukprot:scaffold2411_cov156-Amphora_coffeaeformis.AAC.4
MTSWLPSNANCWEPKLIHELRVSRATFVDYQPTTWKPPSSLRGRTIFFLSPLQLIDVLKCENEILRLLLVWTIPVHFFCVCKKSATSCRPGNPLPYTIPEQVM